MRSTRIIPYVHDQNIKHKITLNHAAVAERTIRTIKDMIYKRIEDIEKPWTDVLYSVLLTYNHKIIHSVTKFTPADAMKPVYEWMVKTHLEIQRRSTRKYPDVDVGDHVKTFRKKTNV